MTSSCPRFIPPKPWKPSICAERSIVVTTTVGRQARLAQALEGIDVRPLDQALGRAAGALLAAARLPDVIDAAVVALSVDGDEIVTADLDAFQRLALASGRHVELIRP